MARRGRSRKKKPFLIGRRDAFTLKLESVEITRGHDGFLSGNPEPALLLAALGVSPGRACLLSRALRRLAVTTPFPATVQPEEPVLFRVELPPGCPRVALLGLAVEEDRGDDVEALYSALGQADALDAWTLGTELPEPRGLGELSDAPPTPPPEASRVDLLRDGVHLGDACRHDSWIGAALVLLAADQPAHRRWRMPFFSADGRNDWTANLRITG